MKEIPCVQYNALRHQMLQVLVVIVCCSAHQYHYFELGLVLFQDFKRIIIMLFIMVIIYWHFIELHVPSSTTLSCTTPSMPSFLLRSWSAKCDIKASIIAACREKICISFVTVMPFSTAPNWNWLFLINDSQLEIMTLTNLYKYTRQTFRIVIGTWWFTKIPW